MQEIQVIEPRAWTPTLGATVLPEGGVAFRVWAPAARTVEVEIEGSGVLYPLAPASDDGEFGGIVARAGAGTRYRYRLDGGPSYPDPCSRSQPAGPHGPSEVIDPDAFAWTDAEWPGIEAAGLVIYECHVGAFTPAGTFDAIIPRLRDLAELGVTALELMPVAEFPGERGWGYDGVNLAAPHHAYGGPEGLRRLVDAAHAEGLAVILDVVYNHLGPDGNYLRAFAPDYFTDRHQTPWGDALNYDGRNSHRVREFVITNIWRWVREFRIDGFRLDAVNQIRDESAWHILADLTARARGAAYPRSVVVIAEDERNLPQLVRSPGADGYGLDAVWADDFHHAVRVHLTGAGEGYYAAYTGTTEEIARTIAGGFLYQGQAMPGGGPRGAPVADEPASAFVFAIQNHDQIGNRALGERLNALVSPAAYRVASALLLLAPETPLLFMGGEFAASAPFLFFTDHGEELGRLVTEGRRREFAAFAAFTDPNARAQIPDPQAEATFRRSTLDWGERETNAAVLRLYTDLLTLRREDPVLAAQDRPAMRASAPTAEVVALHRWQEEEHRLILVNFGAAAAVRLADALAEGTPAGDWQVRWHSDAESYGGGGELPAVTGESIAVPAATAVLLVRTPAHEMIVG